MSWFTKIFGKLGWPFSDGTALWETNPCKAAAQRWLKVHTEYYECGKLWYYRDLNHWEGYVDYQDRYHSIVWYVTNGEKKYYDPLLMEDVELSPTERESIVYEGI